MPRVRHVVQDLMRSWGLRTVFGNPGSTELPFLEEWPADFRYVLGLQESTVVAMADGHAQYTGNAAVVNLHSAGGLGHGLGSLVTAYKNRSPLIVICGQQSRSLLPYDPFLGAIDAASFPHPYVKWSVEPARAADVPAAFARAYQLAMQAPRAPTLLSVPADDWNAPAAPVTARPPIAGAAADPEALADLAARLNASRRPALVVGAAVDADGAVPDAVRLAERARAAVWQSPMSARCSFPEQHALFAGFLPPVPQQLAEALARYDFVLVVGAPAFTYHVTSPEPWPALPPLYLLNDDPQALAWAPHGHALSASPRRALAALLPLISESGRAAPPPRRRPPAPAAVEGRPLSGAYVLATVAQLLPEGAVVVEEIPSHRNDLHEYLPITAPEKGFFTVASGVLGYGLPAAVGVGLAAGNRPVVALLGDGSAMYSIQALWSAVRERARVTFVIFDNSAYASVEALARASGATGLPPIGLGGIDFCGLAQALGCSARLVREAGELRAALSEAFAAGEPWLLNVRVDPETRPIY